MIDAQLSFSSQQGGLLSVGMEIKVCQLSEFPAPGGVQVHFLRITHFKVQAAGAV